eukprot:GABV01009768.1.p1 GENE.GABV01009768.1~~GABV01009768.1.p1  ORF type:complete len:100 (+),score=6.70 GABV01009768.1:3-302(+)
MAPAGADVVERGSSRRIRRRIAKRTANGVGFAEGTGEMDAVGEVWRMLEKFLSEISIFKHVSIAWESFHPLVGERVEPDFFQCKEWVMWAFWKLFRFGC